MKDKIKLTELTKDELQQVRGGVTAIIKDEIKCPCKITNTFGDHDSRNIAGPKPISPKPIVQP